MAGGTPDHPLWMLFVGLALRSLRADGVGKRILARQRLKTGFTLATDGLRPMAPVRSFRNRSLAIESSRLFSTDRDGRIPSFRSSTANLRLSEPNSNGADRPGCRSRRGRLPTGGATSLRVGLTTLATPAWLQCSACMKPPGCTMSPSVTTVPPSAWSCDRFEAWPASRTRWTFATWVRCERPGQMLVAWPA